MATILQTGGCQDKSDIEVVELVLSDQEYFSCLVDRYQEKLARYIRRITNIPEEEVEDLLQEIFIKVFRNLQDFDTSLKFSSWIYRITHNETISHFRKAQARPQTTDLFAESVVIDKVKTEFDIDEAIDNEFLNDKIEVALAGLDAKYREVIVLRFFEERDYQEIADILRKPVGTVGTLLNRAKRKLIQELEKLHESTK